MGGPGSGRALTPGGRENRRQSARNASDAARKAAGGGSMGDDMEGAIDPEVVPPAGKGTPLTDEELLSLLPGSNPYDKVVLRSRGRFTYLDGKTREQVRGVELDNQTKSAEVEKARGQAFTLEQVRERDDQVAELFKRELSTLPDLLRELVPADRLLAAQRRADEWINKVRTEIADAVEGMK